MLERFLIPAALLLIVPACESPGAEFSPPPGSYSASRATIEGVAGPRMIASVDSTFFGGNLPMLGRRFLPAEHRGEGSRTAMLHHAFWVEHFGERPDIIGSELEVDGVARTIVGIMPAGFDSPPDVVLWIPRTTD